MKRLIPVLLILSVVSLTGCGDKEAREYAAKLLPVLGDYQTELSQKIKAEQETYDTTDRRFTEAAKREITIRLAAERRNRSEELGDEIARADDPPTMSEVLAALEDYGDHDFKTTQSILGAAMNTRSSYVAELENLEIELQKIKLLKESLTELAKSKTGSKEFKEAAAFLQKTHAELAKNPCGDLQKQLTALKTEANTRDGEKKDVDQDIKRISERLTVASCN
jgi:predicted small lipoprotein YifL